MKKMILTVFAVCMCLWFIFASTPGPKLVNVNINDQDPGVKTKGLQPPSDMKTLQPDIDFGKIPLYFIANKGQVNAKASFYAKASRYTLWMTKEGLVFDSFRKVEAETTHPAPSMHPSQEGSCKMECDVSRLMFVGANKRPEISAIQPAKLKVNYFIGNDKSKWKSGVPTSMSVLYKSLYKNVDLKVYGIEKQIEYDWIVKPGGSPGDIKIRYQNVKGTRIDEEGNLLIETGFGELMHKRPFSYQNKGSEKIEVKAEFKKIGKNTYGFAVGNYDKNHELVIDPVIVYSTFFGGSWSEHLRHITIDDAGYLYVTGLTRSPDFPASNSYLGGWSDGFVAKIDYPDNSTPSLVYCAYIGGNGTDAGNKITLDKCGSVYVLGSTTSNNFPKINSYQGYKGDHDVFIMKLKITPNGTGQLLFSSLLGGYNSDIPLGIVVDDNGFIYVGGTTGSPNFPIKNHYQGDYAPYDDDSFVFKLDPSQIGTAQLLYSTYLRGSKEDRGGDIAVDDAGCIYFVGYTDSDDFPTKNQFQNNQPARDGFISKIDPNEIGAASLLYSSYIGGNGADNASQIFLNSDGSVYVVGNTNSSNFPTLNQYQGDQPGYDVFVTRLDITGSGSNQLLYSTYLGGSGDEGNAGIVLDDSGKVYLVGSTNSADFPLLGEYQGYGGGGDIYVTLLNPANTGTSQLLFSTYLGGGARENGTAMVLDSKGNAYVTGITSSPDFPIVYPYYQENLKGGDGTITKFSFNKPPVADAGADVSCVQKDTVTLDGSASYDPDGDPLIYSWMIEFKPNGSNAVLSDVNKVAPSLETDLPGDYVIKLVVNDGTVDSNPSFVTVTAKTFAAALTEKINNLNTTLDSIPVSSFSNKQHKTNMIKFVGQAMDSIAAGDYCGAKDKLTNVQRKVDGCNGGNANDDWITTCPTKTPVYLLIQEALDLIEQIILNMNITC